VRTVHDLHQALAAMGEAAMAQHKDLLFTDEFPPAGKRFDFPGGVAVLKRDPDTGERIVTTVLEPREGAE
jgi:hypothetical protein